MKKVLFLLHVIVASILVAQSNTEISLVNKLEQYPEEKIHLHFNKDFLITGEKLFYKIYCLNNLNEFSPFSKIAYVELIDKNNNSISKQKIHLNNGKGYGDFFIDTKVNTGAYKLISYTKWMLNKVTYFQKDIIIINPFSNKTNSISSDSTSTNNNLIASNKKDLIFKNINNSYNKRSKIALTFLPSILNNFNGDFSISVKLKDNFEIPSTNKKTLTPSNNKLIYLPELRGSLIKGKINSNTSKLSNVKLSLSFENNSTLPLTAITNDLGEFYFNIENNNTNKILISILEKNEADYTIELTDSKLQNVNFENFAKIELSKEMIETIKTRSLYSQIENAYYSVKKDSILKSTSKDALLDKIKTIYPLDDYKRFNTVKETFIEVIEGAGFYKKENTFHINVTDTDASETLSYLPSLLIIDGKIVNDHTNFMSYNSRNIKTISLIKDKYFYGNAIYQGIVIVDTFKGDYIDSGLKFKEFNIMPVEPEKIYFFQDHKNNNKRVPDYRTQLYWNPEIAKNNKELIFYTSDVSGIYEINIQGYNNKGKLISLKSDFKVN